MNIDPCDALKAFQLQLKRDKPDYKKSQNEDLVHMATGLNGRKGRVHFAFGTPINDSLDALRGLNKNEQIAAIAQIVDSQIYANYRLTPGNYVSLDTLNANDAHADKYTPQQRNQLQPLASRYV